VVKNTRGRGPDIKPNHLLIRKIKQTEKNILRIKSVQKARHILPIMILSSYKKQRLQVVKSRSLIYRTIATTPAAKARPPNPAPTTAAPPVEAAGLLEALLEAEEAELAADFVAVLMELAALDTALEIEPVAELCLLEAAEEAEDCGGSQINWHV
jgi:hypothetical protein